MKLGKTLYVADRKAWRAWLARHHAKEDEIWLVYPRKHTGRPRIPYNDAVEEALCFGWIDSTVKAIDEESYAQRFSKRKGRAKWSQANIERMRRLIRLGKVLPAGLAALGDPKVLQQRARLTIAPDILAALKSDRATWKNFQRFPASYRRIRVAFIEHARKRGEAEFQKRLRFFVKKTKENKQFMFGTAPKASKAH